MTDREIMQQALDALDSGVDVQMERVVWTEYDSELVEQAITALRERLAQPEQEPIKESSITHGHLWIGDLYGKEENT